MTLNDPLANVLSMIQNAETRGQREIRTRNNSTLIRQVLAIMIEHGYLDSVEQTDDVKGNELIIKLNGRINKTGVIKPRYQIKQDSFERFEKRYLPARGFGIIIVSTNKGLVTHPVAKEAKIGGTLISYCY